MKMYPGESCRHASAVAEVASADICSGKSGGNPDQVTLASLSCCLGRLGLGRVTVVSAAPTTTDKGLR